MLQTNETHAETTTPEVETTTPKPARRIFNVPGSVEYLRSIGVTGANPYFVRTMIASGRVPHVQIGKQFYVTRAAWDAWLAKSERRKRV